MALLPATGSVQLGMLLTTTFAGAVLSAIGNRRDMRADSPRSAFLFSLDGAPQSEVRQSNAGRQLRHPAGSLLGIADVQRDPSRRVVVIDRDDGGEAARHAVPLSYWRSKPLARSKLDGFTVIIDQIGATPMSEGLRSDATDPVGPWAAFIRRLTIGSRGPTSCTAYGPKNVFRHEHGAGVREYRAQHAEEGAIFRLSSGLPYGQTKICSFGNRYRYTNIVDIADSCLK